MVATRMAATAAGTVGAVVLAAGSASRMGGRPKCLLELNGEALICRQITALLDAGVGELVLVLGFYGHDITQCVTTQFPQFAGGPGPQSFQLVWNPRPEAGQISSQRLGLAALSPKHEAVLVALADQPLIDAQDIRDVIAAHRARPADRDVTVPMDQGLPGNPVVLSAQVRAAILQSDASVGGKQWQRAHAQRVHRWETANTHYRWDVDTPQDIERLAAQSGHRLAWPDCTVGQ